MKKKQRAAKRVKAHPHEHRLVAGVIGVLMVAAAIQGPWPKAQLLESRFPDVQAETLEIHAAEFLADLGIIQGFPDGTFRGVLVLNRAQAAKIMLLASGKTVLQSRNAGFFRDMPDTAWYVPYVITAALKGIVSGYPDRTFKPAQQVNTAEFLKMMALAFDMPTHFSHSYPDVPAKDWYAKYAGMAERYDLFPYRAGFLGPHLPISRSEAAIAIYQYIKSTNPQPPSSSSRSSLQQAGGSTSSFGQLSSSSEFSSDSSSAVSSSSFSSLQFSSMGDSSSFSSLSSSSSRYSSSSSSSKRPALCGDGRCDQEEQNACLKQVCNPGFVCPPCTPSSDYCASDCR